MTFDFGSERQALVLRFLLAVVCVLPLASGSSNRALRSRSLGVAEATLSIDTDLQRNTSSPSSNSSGTSGNSSSTLSSAAASSSNTSSLQDVLNNGLVDGKISTLYWAEIDRTIAAAGLVTPQPPSLNDLGPTPTPDPYTSILGVQKTASSADDATATLANYELVTPPPPIPPHAASVPKVSVLPYQMTLGAEVLRGMSEKVTPEPLPAQELVDASFAAQCPMVMLSNDVFVTPPCDHGDGFGTWSDPANTRNVLRWKPNDRGGVDYNVDSAVTGPGSVNFATVTEKFTLNSNTFALYNCMNVMRYTIEETIVKVAHMAPAAQSTASDHDLGETAPAVFYQYLIKHANGSLMAQTSQYRLPETDINFTSFIPGSLQTDVFAMAKRQGRWEGTGWRDCRTPQKGWNISFPEKKGDNLVAIATVQDLQVAALAVLTLLAWREETVGSDGFEHAGQFSMYWSLTSTVLYLLLAALVAIAVLIVLQRFGWHGKLKRLFFRLEEVLLPKRPHQVRQPVLKAAW